MLSTANKQNVALSLTRAATLFARYFSSEEHYKIVVVGGGAAGCAASASLGRTFGKQVAIIEPKDYHYYMPMWTMVGGGLKTLEQSRKPMSQVISKKVEWIKSPVKKFEPDSNSLRLEDDRKLRYDYLVMATGMENKFDAIKGLRDALDNYANVSTNYDQNYVQKTWENIKNFKGGDCVFTMPNGPVRCAGAPQKIMYIAWDRFHRKGISKNVTFNYNTGIPRIFGCAHYAEPLEKLCEKKGINVNCKLDLIEIKPDKNEAVFKILDTEDETRTFHYDFMHVTPKMGPTDLVKQCVLTDDSGFVTVDKETLQHTKYPNVFALGDCANLPTSKTAAAISEQLCVMENNLRSYMQGQVLKRKYDGYTSCPLVTGIDRLILAEFGYGGVPMETFPFDQRKESWSMFILKKDLMPILYWQGLVKGFWKGPKDVRKVAHFGMV
eukprot:TRINITY_DN14906_c1_g1_i2.p1 TRINITY_DN14906_c1_g1~~TRINITY_DN14906_c1_g1_i2.p1  ORF type:complete len:438 (-),score=46.29 TRINITY_DN14906_c1_g1_i2:684-1997(-)